MTFSICRPSPWAVWGISFRVESRWKNLEQFEAPVRAKELATERLHYGDPNFRHSSCTSSTNLPDSQSMEFVLLLVMIAIEEHHKYRDGTGWRQIAPVPI
ncbi:hypothetical protein HBI55_073010 [Parastagonospora nodorum]|nr:hypothetical protein HBH50_059700 [Parastagonospora nodorum]KAH4088885.1 hypothetical protein HBH48_120220 [Parastagonospora nodorum]KAH5541997.1 hypothetical protein HBI27_085120 [Parastagonospora nodorum]KAH6344000.1 hypothetical protein HBI37_088730 [Parastagonospora nodorum]KAH6349655.1 hypothetical protein HBI36_128740 [Parastagonospora nodorum]